MTPAAPAIARVPRRAQRTLFDPARPGGAAERRMDTRQRAGGDGLTLGLRLDRAWEGLSAVGAAACPVCDGPLRRATPDAPDASCGRCGTTLA